MTKHNKQEDKAQTEQKSKLQLKESGLKIYNFLMFLGTSIGAYILHFNGNSQVLDVVAVILLVDAAVHVYKLVAVVK